MTRQLQHPRLPRGLALTIGVAASFTIEANGSRRPTVTKAWRTEARLMLDRDGRTETKVHVAIDWCQDHSFWRSNILSMGKLREKYDQMRLRATDELAEQRDHRPVQPVPAYAEIPALPPDALPWQQPSASTQRQGAVA